MIIRMSEKFGSDQNTIRIIKQCLTAKLQGRDKIDPSILGQVENDIG